MTARQVLEAIQKNIAVPWQSQQPDGDADGLQFGSMDIAVTGVAVTYTPSLATLQRAVDEQRNLIVCRQGPFYSRGEKFPAFYREGAAPAADLLEDDLICAAKRRFIAAHNLAILRLADNWDARPENNQLLGLTRALGWENFQPDIRDRALGTDTYAFFELPEATLAHLATDLRSRLGLQTVRVIGRPETLIRTAALTHGLLLVDQVEKLRRGKPVDVIVGGDVVEWEAAPYVQDLVTAGLAKGLVLLGVEASDEPGCKQMATWMKSFLSELRIAWVPSGEPFWRLPAPVEA